MLNTEIRRHGSCVSCDGRGLIRHTAMGTRLHQWVTRCAFCAGSGMTIEELVAARRRVSGRYQPTGRWVPGYGPGHRIWKSYK